MRKSKKTEIYSKTRESHHVGYICITCNPRGAGPFGFDEKTKGGGPIINFHLDNDHAILYLTQEQFDHECRDDTII